MLNRSVCCSIVSQVILPLLVVPFLGACGGGGGSAGSDPSPFGAGGSDSTASTGGASDTSGGSTGNSVPVCATENDGTYVLEPTDTYKSIGYLKADAANLYFLDDDQLYEMPLGGGVAQKLASDVEQYWVRDTDVLIQHSFSHVGAVSKAGGAEQSLPDVGLLSDREELVGDTILNFALDFDVKNQYTASTHQIKTGEEATLATFQSTDSPSMIVVDQTVFVVTTEGTDYIGDGESPARRAHLQAIQIKDGSMTEVPTSPPARNLRVLGASGDSLILLGEPKNTGVDEAARKLSIYKLPQTGGTLQSIGSTGDHPASSGLYTGVPLNGGVVLVKTSSPPKFLWISPTASAPTTIAWCSTTATLSSAARLRDVWAPQVVAAQQGSLFLSVNVSPGVAITQVDMPK